MRPFDEIYGDTYGLNRNISTSQLMDMVGSTVYEENEETGKPDFPSDITTMLEDFELTEDSVLTIDTLADINRLRFFDNPDDVHGLLTVKDVLANNGYTYLSNQLETFDPFSTGREYDIENEMGQEF